MTLDEQNEHANALMAIAANRHLQFAKQLIMLAQQHVQAAVDGIPQGARQQELKAINGALLTESYNIDSLPPQEV